MAEQDNTGHQPIDARYVRFLENARWGGLTNCPYCKSRRVTAIEKGLRHHCNNCNTSFSVTVGTIFHRTRLDLEKWFRAIDLFISSNGRISGRQLAKEIKVSKDTGCKILHKVTIAFHDTQQRKLLLAIAETGQSLSRGHES